MGSLRQGIPGHRVQKACSVKFTSCLNETKTNSKDPTNCRHCLGIIPYNHLGAVLGSSGLKRLMRWKVNGIITDYPDILVSLWQTRAGQTP